MARCRFFRNFGFFYVIGLFAQKTEWFLEKVRTKLMLDHGGLIP
jgi:hypothetical protein